MTVPDTSSFGGLSVTDKDGNVILFESQAICVLQDDKIIFTYPLLPYDLVEGMYMDDHSRLWVIYRYSGLTIFSLHPGSPAGYLKKEFSFTSEFEDSSPRSMVVDGNGILWVGTRYKGLMGFTFESDQLKKIYQFQTHNGLTDNFITSLACDKNNNIIIGTQTGLDRLIKTKEGYRPENITKSNNLFSYINNVWTDGNDNAFAWTKTGEILRMEPVMPANNRTVPELLVEEIKINGKQVTGLGSHFRLNYEQRNITFSVAAPSFIDEKQIKYSYLLSGDGSKEWSDTTSLADINLLNLSPGNYTLHVKAFFSSTNYASKETEFSFSILPPWWKTWWFRIAAALMVIALLIIVTRSYYRQKLEKQRSLSERQQAIEKERTRIATDMHDDLGAGLSTIRFLSEKVKRNSFSDVTKDDADKIVGNADDLVQKMNEIIWAMNEKNDTLEDLIFYTRNYAVEYAEENNLDCHVTLPENIPVVFVNGEVRRNVFLTVKESLHNVVKHAAAKKVNIRISTGKNLEVAIEDNGIGFEENEQSDGNGLKNMKKRIESINGSFDILHTTGTTVLMKVPL